MRLDYFLQGLKLQMVHCVGKGFDLVGVTTELSDYGFRPSSLSAQRMQDDSSSQEDVRCF